jgi:class 3 adenylate cyclase
MDEAQKLDRTWLCSVAFMDIVKYSCESQDVQIRWKEFFNHELSQALKPVPDEERVIIDTGDGAAVCFLGDPEPALICAVTMQHEFLEAGNQDPCGPLIRLGINLGPVKLTRDINGNLSAIGDGINVAQRIMSFSGINQICVSKSYFDVITRISEEYSRMFRFAGMRLDKHIRQYAVYELIPPGGQAAATAPEAAPAEPEVHVESSPPSLPPAALDPAALRKIEESLAVTMGPISTYLVASLAKKAPDLPALCEMLASRIPATAEQEEFLKRCRSSLGDSYRKAPEEAVSRGAEFASKPSNQPEQLFPAPLLEELQTDLAHFIGPVARIIVERSARKSSTVKELCEAVSNHIASESDRRKFLASINWPGTNQLPN